MAGNGEISLIVYNEIVVLKLTSVMLKKLDYEVMTASASSVAMLLAME